MSNSRKNTINGAVQEEINRQVNEALNRVSELAHPSDLKAASPIQQKYFLLMRYEQDPKTRIELAKKMQREMAEQSSVNVNAKL